MVPPCHGKSWNLGRPFSRPGKSWKIAKVMGSHVKVTENDDGSDPHVKTLPPVAFSRQQNA